MRLMQRHSTQTAARWAAEIKQAEPNFARPA